MFYGIGEGGGVGGGSKRLQGLLPQSKIEHEEDNKRDKFREREEDREERKKKGREKTQQLKERNRRELKNRDISKDY